MAALRRAVDSFITALEPTDKADKAVEKADKAVESARRRAASADTVNRVRAQARTPLDTVWSAAKAGLKAQRAPEAKADKERSGGHAAAGSRIAMKRFLERGDALGPAIDE